MMLKLCFNSTTLRNIDLFEALSLIKDYGYEGAELTLNGTHLHPLNHGPQRFKELKAHCEDNGIDIVCLAAGGPNVLGDEPYEPSLIHANPSKRNQRVDFIKRSNIRPFFGSDLRPDKHVHRSKNPSSWLNL